MKNITIAGRLTRDAKLNRTGSGDPILNFSVAVDDFSGKEKGTEFFGVSLWGKRAGTLEQYLTKGTSVSVCGDLSRREHEGKTYFQVRADNVTLMGGGKREEEPEHKATSARQAPGAMAAAMDDDIPFGMEWR